MEPTEVTVGTHTYQIGKLDAFAQLHVMRRMAPLLTGLQSISELQLDSALPTILKSLAEMEDADVEYIMTKCLAVVRRKVPGGTHTLVPVWNAQAKRPQFDDLELAQLLQLVGQVIMGNLGGFLGGLGPLIDSQKSPPDRPVN